MSLYLSIESYVYEIHIEVNNKYHHRKNYQQKKKKETHLHSTYSTMPVTVGEKKTVQVNDGKVTHPNPNIYKFVLFTTLCYATST